jgi:hypothetical protein
MSGRYDILLRRFLTGVNPYIKYMHKHAEKINTPDFVGFAFAEFIYDNKTHPQLDIGSLLPKLLMDCHFSTGDIFLDIGL